MKDIAKLDPYVKVEIRGSEIWKRETTVKKDTGSNVLWNETLQFPQVQDNLAFVRYFTPGCGMFIVGFY